MSTEQGPEIELDGRHVISLSSNDYLGLTHHPQVLEAATRALHRDGAHVAELTGLLPPGTLADYPPGTRVLIRRERPHPGAQLRLTDAEG